MVSWLEFTNSQPRFFIHFVNHMYTTPNPTPQKKKKKKNCQICMQVVAKEAHQKANFQIWNKDYYFRFTDRSTDFQIAYYLGMKFDHVKKVKAIACTYLPPNRSRNQAYFRSTQRFTRWSPIFLIWAWTWNLNGTKICRSFKGTIVRYRTWGWGGW